MQIISLFLSKDSRTFMLELKAQSRHNVEKSVWNNGLCEGASEHGNLKRNQ
jgi:hypothetical protein